GETVEGAALRKPDLLLQPPDAELPGAMGERDLVAIDRRPHRQHAGARLHLRLDDIAADGRRQIRHFLVGKPDDAVGATVWPDHGKAAGRAADVGDEHCGCGLRHSGPACRSRSAKVAAAGAKSIPPRAAGSTVWAGASRLTK